MRNLLIILCFTILSNAAHSQITLPDLRDKNLSSKHRDNLKGKWKSKSENIHIEANINVEKRKVKLGLNNFSTDHFIVNITKYTRKGENHSSQVKNLEMPFIFLNSDDNYHSTFKDLLTGIDIYATLKLTGRNTISLSFNLPEKDAINDVIKGTILPKMITLYKE
ncbi:MAG TPA: hypothetical protein VGD22_03155 [Sphingobacteriaceae bacterium]